MAAEMNAVFSTGDTNLYFILNRESDGYFYNTNSTAFEAGDDTNWDLEYYGFSATEVAATGRYEANIPAGLADGVYTFVMYQKQGGTQGHTDPYVSGIGELVIVSGSVINNHSILARLTVIQGSGFNASTDTLEKLADAIAGVGSDPLTSIVPGNYADGTAGAALGRIGTGRIDVRSWVEANGDISIVKGDDYNASDNTALDWVGSEANIWPDLTDATITFYLNDGSFNATGSVVTGTGTQRIRLELTATQTATLSEGVFKFGIRATLSNGRKTTLIRERICTVYDDESGA